MVKHVKKHLWELTTVYQPTPTTSHCATVGGKTEEDLRAYPRSEPDKCNSLQSLE